MLVQLDGTATRDSAAAFGPLKHDHLLLPSYLSSAQQLMKRKQTLVVVLILAFIVCSADVHHSYNSFI